MCLYPKKGVKGTFAKTALHLECGQVLPWLGGGIFAELPFCDTSNLHRCCRGFLVAFRSQFLEEHSDRALSPSLYVFLSISLYISISLHLLLSFPPSLPPSLPLYICLSVWLCVCVSLSVCMSRCLFVSSSSRFSLFDFGEVNQLRVTLFCVS